ncbi:MAG TPA: hypothetical protein VJM74_03315 [Nitrososphaeraceae archaeon]|nr:hypothetical protein [Nitrososphaeraceae archaeon]
MYEIVSGTFVILTGILFAVRYIYRSKRAAKTFRTPKPGIDSMTSKSKTK